MKWYATFKWEAINDFKHLRKIIVPALAIWGLMMLMSFIMPVGVNQLWLMYLPVAIAGGCMAAFYPFFTADGYTKARRLAQMQSGRPVYVFVIVRLLYNIIVSAAGMGLLYLGSIALYRLGITWIDFLPYLLMMDNIFHEFTFGRVLAIIYVLAVWLPAWGLASSAAACCTNRRWTVLSLGLGWIPFLLLITSAFIITPGADTAFFANENPFFPNRQIGTAEVLILTALTASPIINVALGSWLLDKKADFG